MKKLEIALKIIRLIKGGTLFGMITTCLICLLSLFKDKMILIKGFENKYIGLGVFILFCLLVVLIGYFFEKITSTVNVYINIGNNIAQIFAWVTTMIYTITAFFQKANHLGEVYKNQLFCVQKNFSILEKKEWLDTIRETCCSKMPQKVWDGLINQINFKQITNYNDLVETLKNKIMVVQTLSSESLKKINIDYESPINKILKESFYWMYHNPLVTIAIISSITLTIYCFKEFLSDSFMLIADGFKNVGALGNLLKSNTQLSLEISAELQSLAKVLQNNQISILELQNGLASLQAKVGALSDILGKNNFIVKNHCEDINSLSNIIQEIINNK